MNPYDLHIAYVSWGDDGKSAAIQLRYFAIKNWAQAGLAKSYYATNAHWKFIRK